MCWDHIIESEEVLPLRLSSSLGSDPEIDIAGAVCLGDQLLTEQISSSLLQDAPAAHDMEACAAQ